MKDDTGARRWSRPARTGFLAIAAGAVPLTAAACSSSSSSPQVASLGNSGTAPAAGSGSGGGSPAAGTTGDPVALLKEWAACMRSHGDPGQAEPTIDASKVIHVTLPTSVPGGLSGSNGQASNGPGTHCRTYMRDAVAALRGGHLFKQPTPAEQVKYAKCMRANGIPDCPDPGPHGLSLNASSGGDLNPKNPAFQQAAKTCTAKTGLPALGGGVPQPGAIDMNNLPHLFYINS